PVPAAVGAADDRRLVEFHVGDENLSPLAAAPPPGAQQEHIVHPECLDAEAHAEVTVGDHVEVGPPARRHLVERGAPPPPRCERPVKPDIGTGEMAPVTGTSRHGNPPSYPHQGTVIYSANTLGAASFEVRRASSRPNAAGPNAPAFPPSSRGPKAAWATTTAPCASTAWRIAGSVPFGATAKVQNTAAGLPPSRGRPASQVRIALAGRTPVTTKPSTQPPTTKKSAAASSARPTLVIGSTRTWSPRAEKPSAIASAARAVLPPTLA